MYGGCDGKDTEFGRKGSINCCQDNRVIVNQETCRGLGFVFFPPGDICLKGFLSFGLFLLGGIMCPVLAESLISKRKLEI